MSDCLGSVEKNGITFAVYPEEDIELGDMIDTKGVFFWSRDFDLNNNKDKIRSAIRELQEKGGVLVPAEYAYYGSGEERVGALDDYAIQFPIKFNDPKTQEMMQVGYLEDAYMPPQKEDYTNEETFNYDYKCYMTSEWDSNATEIVLNYLNEEDMTNRGHDTCDGFAIGKDLQDATSKIENINNVMEYPPVYYILDYGEDSSSLGGISGDENNLKETAKEYINDEVKDESVRATANELIDAFEYGQYQELDSDEVKPSDMDKFVR